jgi:hypothetical protein
MRYALLAACLMLAPFAAAQTPPPGCASPEARQLDFWVGEWDVTWANNGKARNRVTRILDGCVILEQFDGTPGTKLMGHSVSTFDRTTKRWRQTWVDNTGAYLDFTGGIEDGRMVFAREAERDGKKFRQRMVFEDVRADSLKWLWQRSDDGGATWKTQWEIDYRRAR